MVAMPCWAKRAQHLGAHEVGAPAAESWTAGQKSGARAGRIDLRVRLTAGVTPNAAMVDGLPNSTLDERHLDCKCLRRRQMRSFLQLLGVLEKDVET